MSGMTLRSAIGGYFELELEKNHSYHSDKLALNSGRNALKYVLQARRPKMLLLPRYLCDAVMQPVLELQIPYGFYSINDQLEPINLNSFDEESAVLYINYFGLKDRIVNQLAESRKNLIVDNTQAFFSSTVGGTPTFYSARKFFGVPDGAYLGGIELVNVELEPDYSHARFKSLLKRADLDAEEGFSDFQEQESLIADMPILGMSRLTQRILSSVNYEKVAEKRRKNYITLHKALALYNKAEFVELDDGSVPMMYPFWSDSTQIRQTLLQNRVFCPRFWPNVLSDLSDQTGSIEFQLATNIIPLPIDQRYGEQEMEFIASIIVRALSNG